MRQIDFRFPYRKDGQPALVAWLTRHLDARLRDFGPGGPEVLLCDQAQGLVTARFPGHDVRDVLAALERRGIMAAQTGEQAAFYLSPAVAFEDLDHVWGCLFELL